MAIILSEANTQDLVVRRCSLAVGKGQLDGTMDVTCEVEWHGQTEEMPIESIMNEINKTAVFAHGFAVAAQLKER